MADEYVETDRQERWFTYRDLRELFHVMSEFGRTDSFEGFLKKGAHTGDGPEFPTKKEVQVRFHVTTITSRRAKKF
jgi:hypothetical protein